MAKEKMPKWLVRTLIGAAVAVAFIAVFYLIFKPRNDSNDWQTVLRQQGFTPLTELALIAVPQDNARYHSDQTAIGLAFSMDDLVGDDGSLALSPTANPIRAKYAFKVVLNKGPREISRTLNSGIKAELVTKKGQLTPLSLNGNLSSELKFENVLHGTLETFENKVPFFVAALPTPGTNTESKFFWVTDFLAADIKNLKDSKLDVKGKIDQPEFSFPVTLQDRESVNIQGPGLVLAVKGLTVAVRHTGTLGSMALPGVGDPKAISFTPTGSIPIHRILIRRPSPLEVYFDFQGFPGSAAYVKSASDEWSKDSPSRGVATTQPAGVTQPTEIKTVMVTLPVPATQPAAILGDDVIRVILLREDLTGSNTPVVSLELLKAGDGYQLSGEMYEVTAKSGIKRSSP